MVTTIKDLDEWKIIHDSNTSFGFRFSNEQLTNAKSNKYFRVMKEFIQQQENNGVKFFYMCKEGDYGKELWFDVRGSEEQCNECKYGIWHIGDDIVKDKYPVIDIKTMKFMAGSSSGGSPSCCPYFG